MPTFTLKDPKKMGERDPKYGQSYWAYTQESQVPVKFNLMEGDVTDGQKITCEEYSVKTSAKGTDYHQLKKVRPEGVVKSVPQTTKKEWQPRDDDAIRAQWAIGQAIAMDAKPSQVGMSQFDGIEETAKVLFSMVDRVKAPDEPSKPSLSDQWKQKQAEKEQPVSNEEVDSLLASGEPIDLKDIPF